MGNDPKFNAQDDSLAELAKLIDGYRHHLDNMALTMSMDLMQLRAKVNGHLAAVKK